MPSRNPSVPLSFTERLRLCDPLAVSWKGVIYRAASPHYAASKDLVTGIGAKKVGGRWNPVGEFATVYGSVEPETAFAEALAQQRYYGMPVHLALPIVIVAIKVRLSRVLDVSDRRVNEVLAVDPLALATIDWRKLSDAGKEPETHRIGREIYNAGWEAFVIPSGACDGATNLVIFPENVRSGGRLEGLGMDFGQKP